MSRIIDLSLPIDDTAPEPFPVAVDRIGHAEGSTKIGEKFGPPTGDIKPIGPDCFPDGMFISHESVKASVHCGTHVDAPYHFGPESEGRPSKKIEDIPLEWLYGDGVVLDFTQKPPASEITSEDIVESLGRFDFKVMPGNIVLIRTDADKRFGTPEYFSCYPGLSPEATEFLIAIGVKVIGIDSPGLDRPSKAMVDDYYKTRNGAVLWPSHLLGRRREYVHIERLANLDQLPAHGFKFACFPIKIRNVGAAWARAVAIIE